MRGEEVLLMEGCPVVCGDAPSEYYVESPKRIRRSRRMARRRLSGLGQMGFLPPEVIDNLKAGALAAVGAFVADRVAEKIRPYLSKDKPLGPEASAALSVAVGVILGGLVYRFFRRPDFAAALVIGPTVFAGSTLISMYLAPPTETSAAAAPAAGLPATTEGMGLITTEEMQVPVPETPIYQIPLVAGI